MTEWKPSFGPIAQIVDPYARQARLAPALITIFPIALLVFVWLPALHSWFAGLVSFAGSFGILLWLSQIARDEGKKKEAGLYGAWGGKPSVEFLRSTNTRVDVVTKARYRAFLGKRVPGLKFPTDEEERVTPRCADAACESATAWLLTQTRDTKKFSLLFQENVSYGFRRNLWGLKPTGITISLLSALTATCLVVYGYYADHQMPQAEWVISAIVTWVFFAWWLLRVNPDWVRIPADAYAKELLAACDTMQAQSKG